MLAPAIPTYSPPTCLRRFIAHPSGLLTSAGEQFLIVPVESLYPLFQRALPPSRSTTHCCLLLTSGTATLHIGPDPYTIGPGQLLFVRAGQVYSFQRGQQYTGYFCHFHDELLIGPLGSADSLPAFAFLRGWGSPVFALPAQAAGFVEALLQRLLVEFEAHGRQRPDLLRAYLLAMLYELRHATPTDTLPAPSPAVALTNRFKHLVATNFKTLPQVRDYAARLHVTPSHLTKTVRAVTAPPHPVAGGGAGAGGQGAAQPEQHARERSGRHAGPRRRFLLQPALPEAHRGGTAGLPPAGRKVLILAASVLAGRRCRAAPLLPSTRQPRR